MTDKKWLDNVARVALIYNDSRSHRYFQSEEILNFIAYLHEQYGYEYTQPAPTQKTLDTK